MKLKVKGKAVGRPCDQWVVATSINKAGFLTCKSCGNPSDIWQVNFRDIVGVELAEGVRLLFGVTGFHFNMVHVDPILTQEIREID
jgi:hypothetical protein